jgi:hypothetical protein
MAIFIPIHKVDAEKRLVYGTLSEEVRDKSDEILDYASAKPAFEKWSNEIKEASGGKSLGNVRAMHSSIAAGKLTDLKFDDDAKRIEGVAKIVDDNEWVKVCEGVYTGFSIGGGYARRWPDPNNSGVMRYTPTLAEVSIVDNPCVPTATFEYIKADGSVEMRKFTPSHKEDSMDPKALADARQALAKGTASDEQKALIEKADADALLIDAADAMYKSALDAAARGEATDGQKAMIAAAEAKPNLVKDGRPVKPKKDVVQDNAWVAPSDGSRHANKRAAEVHELHLEKKAELAPGLAQMEELLKGAKKPADEDEDEEGDDEETKGAKKARREEKAAKAKEKAEKDDAEMAARKDKEAKEKEEAEKAAAAAALVKKDYSDKERKEMADSREALPDGSFPIKTKKDLENAIQAFGRAKDKDEAKVHIKARAKALGAEDMLPESWGKKKEKSAPMTGLKKGMHQVGWLAHMLNELSCFQDSVEMEQYFEGDKDSELPAKLKSLVSEMCELLVTVVEEETQKLVEDNEDTDVEVMEMAAGLPAGHPDAVAKAVRVKANSLVKSDSKKESEAGAKLVKFAETLEKAGARHSKADAERVQALADHADEVHKCMGKMAETCADMHKAAGKAKNTAIDLGAEGEREDDEDDMEPTTKSAVKMSKALAELSAKNDEVLVITKLATTQNETLLKAIPIIEGLQAQVKTLTEEKSEIAKRVEHLEKQPAAPKGHVRAVSKTQDSGRANGETEAEYTAKLAKMSPLERSRELMKLSMANPQEMPAR